MMLVAIVLKIPSMLMNGQSSLTYGTVDEAMGPYFATIVAELALNLAIDSLADGKGILRMIRTGTGRSPSVTQRISRWYCVWLLLKRKPYLNPSPTSLAAVGPNWQYTANDNDGLGLIGRLPAENLSQEPDKPEHGTSLLDNVYVRTSFPRSPHDNSD